MLLGNSALPGAECQEERPDEVSPNRRFRGAAQLRAFFRGNVPVQIAPVVHPTVCRTPVLGMGHPSRPRQV